MNTQAGILIIDDDTDYCCLLQIALQEVGVAHPVKVFNDGYDAVNFCERSMLPASRAGMAVPALILLDLKMPGLNGLDVLRWIRSQPLLAPVPVVLLTGTQEEECSQALALGATSIHFKPLSYHELVREVTRLRDNYLVPEHLAHAA